MDGLLVHVDAKKVGRQDLLALPTPEPTDTHKPVPHAQVIQALIESLAFRKLDVIRDEYAVSKDTNRMFGFLQIS